MIGMDGVGGVFYLHSDDRIVCILVSSRRVEHAAVTGSMDTLRGGTGQYASQFQYHLKSLMRTYSAASFTWQPTQ